MSETRGSPRTWQASSVDPLGVTVDGRTYKNLRYLVLAFPLGPLGAVVLLHLSNAFASVSGRAAAALFGDSAGTTAERDPTGGEPA